MKKYLSEPSPLPRWQLLVFWVWLTAINVATDFSDLLR